MRAAPLIPVAIALSSGPADASQPMAYLGGAGAMARQISPLLWGLLIVSVVVTITICALVVIGAWRGDARNDVRDPTLAQPPGGAWISVGVGASTVVLIGLVAWSTITMAKIANPPDKPSLSIEVRGHQWWWEAIYLDADGARQFATANEIHIPVGKSVRFRLNSPDVIHSFWVPSLGGKTDVIPGQTNVAWLKADHAGVYRGQCAEYCGQQHAHMIVTVFADNPDSFESWRSAQIMGAPAMQDVKAQVGLELFTQKCGTCHMVRGTRAGGRVGPDLTHLMSRTTIAAGTVPNNSGYLSAWIADPQHIKPGARMPALDLSGSDLESIRTFLATLK